MPDVKISVSESGIRYGKTVFIFPHWGADLWLYKLLGEIFRRCFGLNYVIFLYSDSFLHTNITVTRDNFDYFEKIVLAHAQKQRAFGVNSFGCLGMSLGSVIAARMASVLVSRGLQVSELVLNLSGASFPAVVWNSATTKEIRDGLDVEGVPFSFLVRRWGYLSPIESISRLENCRTLFLASLADTVAGEENVRVLAEKISRNGGMVLLERRRDHRAALIRNFFRWRLMGRFLAE